MALVRSARSRTWEADSSPETYSVVRSLEAVAREAPSLGAELQFLTPAGFRSIPMPTYPEIRLSLTTPAAIASRIEAAAPDHIHIATEGPLGMLARRYCLSHGLPFTTSYHTKFPEYLSARLPVPESLSYALLRRDEECVVTADSPSSCVGA